MVLDILVTWSVKCRRIGKLGSRGNLQVLDETHSFKWRSEIDLHPVRPVGVKRHLVGAKQILHHP